jgi:biopolymer transport protein ExbB/TolQ
MPTVEGFTPSVLWTTLYGVIALCILFMVVYRVYDAIHTIVERRRQRKESQSPDFAEKISRKVVEDINSKWEPRFEEIERNLERDKRRLESHEAAISSMTESQEDIHKGMTAICKFLLVIGNSSSLGNGAQVKEAVNDLAKFLAERV